MSQTAKSKVYEKIADVLPPTFKRFPDQLRSTLIDLLPETSLRQLDETEYQRQLRSLAKKLIVPSGLSGSHADMFDQLLGPDLLLWAQARRSQLEFKLFTRALETAERTKDPTGYMRFLANPHVDVQAFLKNLRFFAQMSADLRDTTPDERESAEMIIRIIQTRNLLEVPELTLLLRNQMHLASVIGDGVFEPEVLSDQDYQAMSEEWDSNNVLNYFFGSTFSDMSPDESLIAGIVEDLDESDAYAKVRKIMFDKGVLFGSDGNLSVIKRIGGNGSVLVAEADGPQTSAYPEGRLLIAVNGNRRLMNYLAVHLFWRATGNKDFLVKLMRLEKDAVVSLFADDPISGIELLKSRLGGIGYSSLVEPIKSRETR